MQLHPPRPVMRRIVSEHWRGKEHGVRSFVQQGCEHFIGRLELLHLRLDLPKIFRGGVESASTAVRFPGKSSGPLIAP